MVIIDDQDRRLEERRIANFLALTFSLSESYQYAIHGAAVESAFNWYWLVDRLQEAGCRVDFMNPAGIKLYEGLKYNDDRYDAFRLAHLMRLGLMKTVYIYLREQRSSVTCCAAACSWSDGF